MMRLKNILLVSVGLLAGVVYGQSNDSLPRVLTLSKAIETAMVNNYDLKIASNSLKQANNSNSPGNAGLFPSLSLSGGTEYGNSDTEVQYNGTGNNPVITTNGAESVSSKASVRLDYTLFDGFGNVYTYKKLKQASLMQEILFRLQMENTVLQVVRYYYDVCRSQRNLQLAKEFMHISKERYTRAKDQKAFGQANQLDLLNAEVDLNSDSTSILIAEQGFLMAVKNLNVVLGVAVDQRYKTDETIDFREDLTAQKVLDLCMENNSALLSQKQMEGISQLDEKIVRAARYPNISLYGQYGYARQDNDAGQLLYSQNIGTTAGATLRFNVFNGHRQHTREQNSKLEYLSQQERTRKLQFELERDAANAFTDYEYKRRIVDLQQSSLAQAQLNFEQTREMFQLGRVTSIEFRTAQQNLLNVANKYSDAKFTAKVAEFSLLKLTGVLVKDL